MCVCVCVCVCVTYMTISVVAETQVNRISVGKYNLSKCIISVVVLLFYFILI